MTDEQEANRALLEAAGGTLFFHCGDAVQGVPGGLERPPEIEPPFARSSKPRWGTDDDGNEIQPPPTGLVFNPETGMAELAPPETTTSS